MDKDNNISEDRADYFFYFLILLIAIYIAIKSIHWPVEKRIDVLLLLQDGQIENLDTPPKPKTIADFEVDTIHFPEGEVFYHENFGYSDFSQEFFLKAQTRMEVKKAGQYNFSIRSDDGFRLSIDGKKICQHPQGRPMGETLCSAELEKGFHHYEIFYYQGYGYLGLEARYEYQPSMPGQSTIVPKHSLNMQFIGRNSDEVKFHHMKNTDLYVNQ